MKVLRSLLLPPLAALPLFAFIDVTPIEIGEHPGTSGSIALSTTLKRGNVDRNDYRLDGDIRYDTNRSDAFWAIGSFDYASSDGDEIENSTLGHLRWLHRLEAPLYTEVFLQTEQNKFKDLSNRSLAGGGLRWRLFDTTKMGKGYLGMGVFYEIIRYRDTTADPNEENSRLNSYLFYTKPFATGAYLNLYAYYQPKIDEMEDYLIVSACEISFPLYGALRLLVSLRGDYDSRPPIGSGVKRYDITQITALQWKFR